MGEFNTVGLEDIIDAFSRREAATVEAVPKMLKAGADVSISKCTVRLRHRPLNAGQRIIYGNEVFEIEAVLPDGKKSFVDAICKVVNADV